MSLRLRYREHGKCVVHVHTVAVINHSVCYRPVREDFRETFCNKCPRKDNFLSQMTFDITLDVTTNNCQWHLRGGVCLKAVYRFLEHWLVYPIIDIKAKYTGNCHLWNFTSVYVQVHRDLGCILQMLPILFIQMTLKTVPLPTQLL